LYLIGWISCDGGKIPEPSPWAGQYTPNLNGNRLFLRGTNPENVLEIQDDSFEDHSHVIVDPGHSHSDTGHTHKHWGFTPGSEGYYYGTSNFHTNEATTYTGYAQITTDKTNIKISSAKEGKSGTETRPKNMGVQWIIRIFFII
jgi:hypothetical protein